MTHRTNITPMCLTVAVLVAGTATTSVAEVGCVCGDGVICGTEVCDDGNTTDCDGCRGDCSAVETGCGDGFICGSEVCDDGFTDACGSCNATCTGPGAGLCCEAPLVHAVGCRYLQITPQPPASVPQAIFITWNCLVGVSGKYVGVPSAFDNDGDNIFDEMVAGLVDDPLNAQFLTPAQWGELYVNGLVPDTSYIVKGDCGSPGNPSLTAGTGATTWDWGDTDGNGGVGPFDISNVLLAYGGHGILPLVATDLMSTGCVPDQITNVFDLLAVYCAFEGNSFTGCTGCARPCDFCSGAPICDDGLFCNGAESCVDGQCRSGLDPCPGACCNVDTCIPCQVQVPVLIPLPKFFPEEGVDLEIRVQNVNDLKAFQITLEITQLSPGGGVNRGHHIGVPRVEGLVENADLSVSVRCPDGVVIETERSDYVFTGVENLTAENCSRRGAVAIAIEDAVDIGDALGYLVTYRLDVSPDATPGSTFEISLGPESYLLDSIGRPIPFSSEPAILTISGDPIPTVSVWGIVLMSLLVLTAATLILAHRRVQPV